MIIIEKLKKAQNLQKQRLFAEAESIYKKIIDHDKNNFDANIGLSIVYFLTNKISISINLLEELIKIYPDRIEAYNNLSNILISQNKYEKAIQYLLVAYKIDKNNIKNLENLSFLYFKKNNFIEAKKYAKLGISLNIKNSFIYNVLGQVFFKENEIQKSITNFKLSIKNNVLFWPAYDNLLTTYEQVNNLHDFNEVLLQANKLFINSQNLVRLKYFQALLLFRNNDFTKSINLLEKIKDKVNIKHHQSFYYLLGKNYDKIKKYDLAFKNFSKSNESILNLDENKKFNKKILLDLIEGYIKYFVKDNINQYDLFDKIDNYIDPVFLLGFPRSGTTLLDTILRTHSQTIVLEEKPYISNIRDEFFQSNDGLINSLEKIKFTQIKNIRKNYFKNIEYFDHKNSSKIIIDKLPLNIIEIGFIRRIFPKSKFILMMRHPYDSILSCFITDFKINDAMIHFLNLNDTANLFNQVFILWKQYVDNLNLKFHLIKYEDLIYNFDDSIKSLLYFLDIKWEDNLKFFNRTATLRDKINTPSYSQVIKPLNANSVARWKNYKEVEQVKDKIKFWIKYFNYPN